MWKRLFLILILLVLAGLCPVPGALAGNETPAPTNPETARILNQLETRYSRKNFSADFKQESTLKAMEITDTAEGKAWFSHPGKMRWEYQSPEKYIIISGGDNLWIYRPADNQVVVGDAKEYFGNGKGASFLSNFSLVKDAFAVTPERQTANQYRLKLVPLKKQYDLSAIYLTVNKTNLDIELVTTENVYGDITKITFSNLTFHPELKESMFEFKVPKGTDIVQMDEDAK